MIEISTIDAIREIGKSYELQVTPKKEVRGFKHGWIEIEAFMQTPDTARLASFFVKKHISNKKTRNALNDILCGAKKGKGNS
jgi:hypothetical protein